MEMSPGFAVPGLYRPLASQTWLWEMQGDRWTGTVEDILDAAAAAGLQGIELTMAVAAPYHSRPRELRAAVEARGLALACVRYSMPTGFTDPADADAEMAGLERAIRFACEAGTQRLGLKGPSHPQPHLDRQVKAEQAYRMCNRVARRSQAAGLTVNVHLHSHPDAIVWTPQEWDAFLRETDPETVFACGDAGHLLRCGHDPAETFARHLSRISHVHLKDAGADGSFPPLGEGILKLPAVVDVLVEGGYQGWVVLEEEHESQIADPAAALAEAAGLIRSAGW